MKPGTILAFSAILVLFLCGMAVADDCGCGSSGLGDLSAYTGGDTHDDWDSSANSNDDAADISTDSSSDSSYGTDSWSSDDGGSTSSSSGSDSSASEGGGSVEDAIVWRMKGDDLFEKGLNNESLEAYEKAIRLDPYALKSWTGKGRALLALARLNGAVDAYERAIRLDPGNAATYVQLGDALTAGGQYEQAVENYLKALAMNPNLPGIEEKIADAEAAVVEAGQTEEATPVITTPPTGKETSMETVTLPEETGTGTTAVPTPLQAGIPGFPSGILALLICVAFLAFRKK